MDEKKKYHIWGLPQLDFITGVNHFRPIHGNPLARIWHYLFPHVKPNHLGSGDRYLNFFRVEFTASQPNFINPSATKVVKKSKDSAWSNHHFGISLKQKQKHYHKIWKQKKKINKRTRGRGHLRPDVNAVGSGWQDGWYFFLFGSSSVRTIVRNGCTVRKFRSIRIRGCRRRRKGGGGVGDRK